MDELTRSVYELSTAGDPSKGVYLYKYLDVALLSRKKAKAALVFVCKICPGRVKQVPVSISDGTVTPRIDPALGYDAHDSQSAPLCSDTQAVICSKSQVYVYDYLDDNGLASYPRQCLPLALLHFSKGDYIRKTVGLAAVGSGLLSSAGPADYTHRPLRHTASDPVRHAPEDCGPADHTHRPHRHTASDRVRHAPKDGGRADHTHRPHRHTASDPVRHAPEDGATELESEWYLKDSTPPFLGHDVEICCFGKSKEDVDIVKRDKVSSLGCRAPAGRQDSCYASPSREVSQVYWDVQGSPLSTATLWPAAGMETDKWHMCEVFGSGVRAAPAGTDSCRSSSTGASPPQGSYRDWSYHHSVSNFQGNVNKVCDTRDYDDVHSFQESVDRAQLEVRVDHSVFSSTRTAGRVAVIDYNHLHPVKNCEDGRHGNHALVLVPVIDYDHRSGTKVPQGSTHSHLSADSKTSVLRDPFRNRDNHVSALDGFVLKDEDRSKNCYSVEKERSSWRDRKIRRDGRRASGPVLRHRKESQDRSLALEVRTSGHGEGVPVSHPGFEPDGFTQGHPVENSGDLLQSDPSAVCSSLKYPEVQDNADRRNQENSLGTGLVFDSENSYRRHEVLNREDSHSSYPSSGWSGSGRRRDSGPLGQHSSGTEGALRVDHVSPSEDQQQKASAGHRKGSAVYSVDLKSSQYTPEKAVTNTKKVYDYGHKKLVTPEESFEDYLYSPLYLLSPTRSSRKAPQETTDKLPSASQVSRGLRQLDDSNSEIIADQQTVSKRYQSDGGDSHIPASVQSAAGHNVQADADHLHLSGVGRPAEQTVSSRSNAHHSEPACSSLKEPTKSGVVQNFPDSTSSPVLEKTRRLQNTVEALDSTSSTPEQGRESTQPSHKAADHTSVLIHSSKKSSAKPCGYDQYYSYADTFSGKALANSCEAEHALDLAGSQRPAEASRCDQYFTCSPDSARGTQVNPTCSGHVVDCADSEGVGEAVTSPVSDAVSSAVKTAVTGPVSDESNSDAVSSAVKTVEECANVRPESSRSKRRASSNKTYTQHPSDALSSRAFRISKERRYGGGVGRCSSGGMIGEHDMNTERQASAGVTHMSGAMNAARHASAGMTHMSGTVTADRPASAGVTHMSGTVTADRPASAGVTHMSGTVTADRPASAGVTHTSEASMTVGMPRQYSDLPVASFQDPRFYPVWVLTSYLSKEAARDLRPGCSSSPDVGGLSPDAPPPLPGCSSSPDVGGLSRDVRLPLPGCSSSPDVGGVSPDVRPPLPGTSGGRLQVTGVNHNLPSHGKAVSGQIQNQNESSARHGPAARQVSDPASGQRSAERSRSYTAGAGQAAIRAVPDWADSDGASVRPVSPSNPAVRPVLLSDPAIRPAPQLSDISAPSKDQNCLHVVEMTHQSSAKPVQKCPSILGQSAKSVSQAPATQQSSVVSQPSHSHRSSRKSTLKLSGAQGSSLRTVPKLSDGHGSSPKSCGSSVSQVLEPPHAQGSSFRTVPKLSDGHGSSRKSGGMSISHVPKPSDSHRSSVKTRLKPSDSYQSSMGSHSKPSNAGGLSVESVPESSDSHLSVQSGPKSSDTRESSVKSLPSLSDAQASSVESVSGPPDMDGPILKPTGNPSDMDRPIKPLSTPSDGESDVRPVSRLSSTARQGIAVPDPAVDYHQRTVKKVPDPAVDYHQGAVQKVPDPAVDYHQGAVQKVPDPAVDYHQGTVQKVPDPAMDHYHGTVQKVLDPAVDHQQMVQAALDPVTEAPEAVVESQQQTVQTRPDLSVDSQQQTVQTRPDLSVDSQQQTIQTEPDLSVDSQQQTVQTEPDLSVDSQQQTVQTRPDLSVDSQQQTVQTRPDLSVDSHQQKVKAALGAGVDTGTGLQTVRAVSDQSKTHLSAVTILGPGDAHQSKVLASDATDTCHSIPPAESDVYSYPSTLLAVSDIAAVRHSPLPVVSEVDDTPQSACLAVSDGVNSHLSVLQALSHNPDTNLSPALAVPHTGDTPSAVSDLTNSHQSPSLAVPHAGDTPSPMSDLTDNHHSPPLAVPHAGDTPSAMSDLTDSHHSPPLAVPHAGDTPSAMSDLTDSHQSPSLAVPHTGDTPSSVSVVSDLADSHHELVADSGDAADREVCAFSEEDIARPFSALGYRHWTEALFDPAMDPEIMLMDETYLGQARLNDCTVCQKAVSLSHVDRGRVEKEQSPVPVPRPLSTHEHVSPVQSEVVCEASPAESSSMTIREMVEAVRKLKRQRKLMKNGQEAISGAEDSSSPGTSQDTSGGSSWLSRTLAPPLCQLTSGDGEEETRTSKNNALTFCGSVLQRGRSELGTEVPGLGDQGVHPSESAGCSLAEVQSSESAGRSLAAGQSSESAGRSLAAGQSSESAGRSLAEVQSSESAGRSLAAGQSSESAGRSLAAGQSSESAGRSLAAGQSSESAGRSLAAGQSSESAGRSLAAGQSSESAAHAQCVLPKSKTRGEEGDFSCPSSKAKKSSVKRDCEGSRQKSNVKEDAKGSKPKTPQESTTSPSSTVWGVSTGTTQRMGKVVVSTSAIKSSKGQSASGLQDHVRELEDSKGQQHTQSGLLQQGPRVGATNVPSGSCSDQPLSEVRGTNTPSGSCSDQPLSEVRGTNTPSGSCSDQPPSKVSGTNIPSGSYLDQPPSKVSGTNIPSGSYLDQPPSKVSVRNVPSGSCSDQPPSEVRATNVPAGPCSDQPPSEDPAPTETHGGIDSADIVSERNGGSGTELSLHPSLREKKKKLRKERRKKKLLKMGFITDAQSAQHSAPKKTLCDGPLDSTVRLSSKLAGKQKKKLKHLKLKIGSPGEAQTADQKTSEDALSDKSSDARAGLPVAPSCKLQKKLKHLETHQSCGSGTAPQANSEKTTLDESTACFPRKRKKKLKLLVKSDCRDTKNDSKDTKSDCRDTINTKSDCRDTKSDCWDTKNDSGDTKSDCRDTKSDCRDTIDTKSDCRDTKSDCRDTKNDCRDTKSESRDTIDTKSDCRDTKSDCRDTKSDCRDTKTSDEANSKQTYFDESAVAADSLYKERKLKHVNKGGSISMTTLDKTNSKETPDDETSEVGAKLPKQSSCKQKKKFKRMKQKVSNFSDHQTAGEKISDSALFSRCSESRVATSADGSCRAEMKKNVWKPDHTSDTQSTGQVTSQKMCDNSNGSGGQLSAGSTLKQKKKLKRVKKLKRLKEGRLTDTQGAGQIHSEEMPWDESADTSSHPKEKARPLIVDHTNNKVKKKKKPLKTSNSENSPNAGDSSPNAGDSGSNAPSGSCSDQPPSKDAAPTETHGGIDGADVVSERNGGSGTELSLHSSLREKKKKLRKERRKKKLLKMGFITDAQSAQHSAPKKTLCDGPLDSTVRLSSKLAGKQKKKLKHLKLKIGSPGEAQTADQKTSEDALSDKSSDARAGLPVAPSCKLQKKLKHLETHQSCGSGTAHQANSEKTTLDESTACFPRKRKKKLKLLVKSDSSDTKNDSKDTKSDCRDTINTKSDCRDTKSDCRDTKNDSKDTKSDCRDTINTKSDCRDTKSDCRDTKNDSKDTKSDCRDTINTKSDCRDTKSDCWDTKNDSGDTKSDCRDTKSDCRDTIDTKSDCRDTKSDCRDTKNDCRDTKSESRDTIDTKSDCRDTKSDCRDTKSDCRDTKSDCRDTKKSDEANSKQTYFDESAVAADCLYKERKLKHVNKGGSISMTTLDKTNSKETPDDETFEVGAKLPKQSSCKQKKKFKRMKQKVSNFSDHQTAGEKNSDSVLFNRCSESRVTTSADGSCRAEMKKNVWKPDHTSDTQSTGQVTSQKMCDNSNGSGGQLSAGSTLKQKKKLKRVKKLKRLKEGRLTDTQGAGQIHSEEMPWDEAVESRAETSADTSSHPKEKAKPLIVDHTNNKVKKKKKLLKASHTDNSPNQTAGEKNSDSVLFSRCSESRVATSAHGSCRAETKKNVWKPDHTSDTQSTDQVTSQKTCDNSNGSGGQLSAGSTLKQKKKLKRVKKLKRLKEGRLTDTQGTGQIHSEEMPWDESADTSSHPKEKTKPLIVDHTNNKVKKKKKLLKASHTDNSPNAGDKSPNAGDKSPNAGDNSPNAGDSSPNADDNGTSAVDNSPNAGDNSPCAGDSLNAVDNSPDAGDNSPNVDDNSPNAGDSGLNAVDSSPNAGDNSLKAGDSCLNAGDNSPKAGDSCLNAGDSCLNAGDSSTNVGENSLNAGDSSPSAGVSSPNAGVSSPNAGETPEEEAGCKGSHVPRAGFSADSPHEQQQKVKPLKKRHSNDCADQRNSAGTPCEESSGAKPDLSDHPAGKRMKKCHTNITVTADQTCADITGGGSAEGTACGHPIPCVSGIPASGRNNCEEDLGVGLEPVVHETVVHSEHEPVVHEGHAQSGSNNLTMVQTAYSPSKIYPVPVYIGGTYTYPRPAQAEGLDSGPCSSKGAESSVRDPWSGAWAGNHSASVVCHLHTTDAKKQERKKDLVDWFSDILERKRSPPSRGLEAKSKKARLNSPSVSSSRLSDPEASSTMFAHRVQNSKQKPQPRSPILQTGGRLLKSAVERKRKSRLHQLQERNPVTGAPPDALPATHNSKGTRRTQSQADPGKHGHVASEKHSNKVKWKTGEICEQIMDSMAEVMQKPTKIFQPSTDGVAKVKQKPTKTFKPTIDSMVANKLDPQDLNKETLSGCRDTTGGNVSDKNASSEKLSLHNREQQPQTASRQHRPNISGTDKNEKSKSKHRKYSKSEMEAHAAVTAQRSGELLITSEGNSSVSGSHKMPNSDASKPVAGRGKTVRRPEEPVSKGGGNLLKIKSPRKSGRLEWSAGCEKWKRRFSKHGKFGKFSPQKRKQRNKCAACRTEKGTGRSDGRKTYSQCHLDFTRRSMKESRLGRPHSKQSPSSSRQVKRLCVDQTRNAQRNKIQNTEVPTLRAGSPENTGNTQGSSGSHASCLQDPDVSAEQGQGVEQQEAGEDLLWLETLEDSWSSPPPLDPYGLADSPTYQEEMEAVRDRIRFWDDTGTQSDEESSVVGGGHGADSGVHLSDQATAAGGCTVQHSVLKGQEDGADSSGLIQGQCWPGAEELNQSMEQADSCTENHMELPASSVNCMLPDSSAQPVTISQRCDKPTPSTVSVDGHRPALVMFASEQRNSQQTTSVKPVVSPHVVKAASSASHDKPSCSSPLPHKAPAPSLPAETRSTSAPTVGETDQVVDSVSASSGQCAGSVTAQTIKDDRVSLAVLAEQAADAAPQPAEHSVSACTVPAKRNTSCTVQAGNGAVSSLGPAKHNTSCTAQAGDGALSSSGPAKHNTSCTEQAGDGAVSSSRPAKPNTSCTVQAGDGSVSSSGPAKHNTSCTEQAGDGAVSFSGPAQDGGGSLSIPGEVKPGATSSPGTDRSTEALLRESIGSYAEDASAEQITKELKIIDECLKLLRALNASAVLVDAMAMVVRDLNDILDGVQQHHVGRLHTRLPDELLLPQERHKVYTEGGSFVILLSSIPRDAYVLLREVKERIASCGSDRAGCNKLPQQNDSIQQLRVRRKNLLQTFTGSVTESRLQEISRTHRGYSVCKNYLLSFLGQQKAVKMTFVNACCDAVHSHLQIVRREVVRSVGSCQFSSPH